jgi:hypothetical protein
VQNSSNDIIPLLTPAITRFFNIGSFCYNRDYNRSRQNNSRNLLARFYDVSSGKILIDGRDLREYTRDSLRSCFRINCTAGYISILRHNSRKHKIWKA